MKRFSNLFYGLCLTAVCGLLLSTPSVSAKTTFISMATGGAGGVYYPKIHAMFMMYPNLYRIAVLKNSGINSVYGVKGKNVSVGAPGSGTEFMTNLVFESGRGEPYGRLPMMRTHVLFRAGSRHKTDRRHHFAEGTATQTFQQ